MINHNVLDVDSLRGRRVLLTGGAGFIGSHLAESLLAEGVELFIVDNLDDFYSVSTKQANLAEIRNSGSYGFFRADICETAAMREIFESTRPEVVVHLAARPGIGASIRDPRHFEKVNVAGTLGLLESCRDYSVKRFVFASSSSIYGDCKTPFTEDHVSLKPISPYAVTKLACEAFAFTYAHLYGISAVCLRYFTVYGPRQRPDLAIHRFVRQIESGEPVSVHGDGTSERDYTYVDDIVAGTMSAIKYRFPKNDAPKFDVFNLGNSRPVKITELLIELEKSTGREVVHNFSAVRAGDVRETCANIGKARRLLGYDPKTSLEDGLAAFVCWYRRQLPAAEGLSRNTEGWEDSTRIEPAQSP